MKICKIWIKDWDQFKDIELDFTDPATGEPAEKICFIGSNGTGKSKLLEIIQIFLLEKGLNHSGPPALILIQVKIKGTFHIICYDEHSPPIYLKNEISFEKDWLANFYKEHRAMKEGKTRFLDHSVLEEIPYPLRQEFGFKAAFSPIIYSPAESIQNSYLNINDVPNSSLQESLALRSETGEYFEVSSSTLNAFWTRLIYLINDRKERQEKFELEENNLKKIKADLLEEFDKENKKPLLELSLIWNKILNKAFLQFNYEKAKIPVHFDENLKAYIYLKNSDEKIDYNLLSTGIRNYIFRLGHIYSLYFNREIDTGFLLVDEPENSLFPDFLYDIIDIYKEVCTDKRGQVNTQMFFATHNPIVAAQFKPHERIILDWNDDGTVKCVPAQAAEGDDPNDILHYDFGVRNLMNKAGLDAWDKVVELNRKLRNGTSEVEKDRYRKELLELSEKYHFSI